MQRGIPKFLIAIKLSNQPNILLDWMRLSQLIFFLTNIELLTLPLILMVSIYPVG